MKRVVVALSGGVDSSAACVLLQRQGYQVIGATLLLKRQHPQDPSELIDTNDVVEKAANIAKFLGIEHIVLDARTAFESQIIDTFVAAYLAGETPNPCVRCNEQLKFAYLYACAQQQQALLATGHYVRIVERNNLFLLKKAAYLPKDQSYFLYRVPQQILAQTLFPLGEKNKSDTRALAASVGLPNSAQSESQDACFISGKVADFINAQAKERVRAGDIVDSHGAVLGQHQGIFRYTVGQRRGLRLGGGPIRYVIALDAKHHQVRVGDLSELEQDVVFIDSIRVFLDKDKIDGQRFWVKLRARHEAAPAQAFFVAADKLRLHFDQVQRGIAPGQSAVLYQDDCVVAGGYIVRNFTES